MKNNVNSKLKGIFGKVSDSKSADSAIKLKKFDLKWKDASKSEIKSKTLKGYEKYAF